MRSEQKLRELLEVDPIIASIKRDEDLEIVLRSQCQVVFILYGSLCTITGIVSTLKEAGKLVFVHADLLEGVSSKDVVGQFLKETTGADGIISAKNNLLKAAKAAGMYTVHRFFLIDSMSLANLTKQAISSDADCIEIMPGYGPKGIRWVLRDMETAGLDKPLIASGLVCSKEDVTNALGAGATAISTTCRSVWDDI